MSANPVIVPFVWNINNPTTLIRQTLKSFTINIPLVYYGNKLQFSLAWVDDNQQPVNFQLDSVKFVIGELTGAIIQNGDWEQDGTNFAWRTNISLDAPILNALLKGGGSTQMVVEAQVTGTNFTQSYLGTITLSNKVIPVVTSPANFFSSSSSSSSSSTMLSFTSSSSPSTSSSRSGSTQARSTSSSSSTIPQSSPSSWTSRSSSSSTQIQVTTSSSSSFHREQYVGSRFGDPAYNQVFTWVGDFNGAPYWTAGSVFLYFNGAGDNGYSLATFPFIGNSGVAYSREIGAGITGDYRRVNGTANGGVISVYVPPSSSSSSSTAVSFSSSSKSTPSSQSSSSSSTAQSLSTSSSSKSSRSSLSSLSSLSMSQSSLLVGGSFALDVQRGTDGGGSGLPSAPASTAFSPLPLTVEAWFRIPHSFIDNMFVMSNTPDDFDTGTWLFAFEPNGDGNVGTMEWNTGDGTTNFSNTAAVQVGMTPVAFGTWFHVAGVATSTYVQLFYNGVSLGTASTTSGGIPSFSGPLNLYDPNWDDFTSDRQFQIDEVRISNSVRYTSNFDPSTAKCWSTDANTVALYRCNEGSGATAHDATGSHNITITGTPGWYSPGIDCGGTGENSSSSTSSTAVSFSTSSSHSSPSSRSSASSLSSASSAGMSQSSSSTFLLPSSASSMSSRSSASLSSASSKSSPSSHSSPSSASSASTSSSTSSPTGAELLVFGDAIIGGGATVTAHKSGTLYLAFNDNYFADNTGGFSAAYSINGGTLHGVTIPTTAGGNPSTGAVVGATAGVATVAVTHGDQIYVQATGTGRWNLSKSVYANGQDTGDFTYQGIADSSFLAPGAMKLSVVGFIA